MQSLIGKTAFSYDPMLQYNHTSIYTCTFIIHLLFHSLTASGRPASLPTPRVYDVLIDSWVYVQPPKRRFSDLFWTDELYYIYLYTLTYFNTICKIKKGITAVYILGHCMFTLLYHFSPRLIQWILANSIIFKL